MIFGFDLDGVLYPWHRVVWEWYRDTIDSSVSFWDFWKYPDGMVATELEGSVLMHNIVENPLLYIAENIAINIVTAVKEINSMSDNIYYITGRPIEVHFITERMLLTSGLPKVDHLFFADDHGGKVALVKEFGCDYYVEDRPKYIEELKNITKVFIVNVPYNQQEFPGTMRLNSVIEIPDILRNGGWVGR